MGGGTRRDIHAGRFARVAWRIERRRGVQESGEAGGGRRRGSIAKEIMTVNKKSKNLVNRFTSTR